MTNGLFDISDDGWIKQNKGRDPWELLREAIQNALDTHSRVWVKVNVRNGKVVVTDEGPGFEKLSDAWTVYGGNKGDDHTKRGRFSRGLKELVAGVVYLKVATTSGTVEFFVNEGRREESDVSRNKGTKIVAQNDDWTKEDFDKLKKYLSSFWAPENQDIVYEVKGGKRTVITREKPDFTTPWQLKTVVYEDQEKKTPRKTADVHIKKTNKGDGRIYEMGIPVNMDEEFPYWIDVQQRVPLAEQRNEVDSTYRKKVMSALLNEVHEDLTKSEMKADWVTEVLNHYNTTTDVKESYVEKVIRDNRKKGVLVKGSEPANDKVKNHGYQVFDTSRAGHAVSKAVREVAQSADEVAGAIQKRQEVQVEPTPEEQEMLDRAKEIAESLGYPELRFQMWELGSGADGSITKADHHDNGIIRLNRDALDWGKWDSARMGMIVHEISHEHGMGHDADWYSAMETNFSKLLDQAGAVDKYE